jgi:hypothetical protein
MLGRKGVPVAGNWGAENEMGERIPATGAAGVAGSDAVAEGSDCATGAGTGTGGWRKTADLAGVGEAIPDSLNLEGDLERDLRSERTVALTST